MPRVRIKQLDERVATTGLHLGGGPERRKLEPGEVVDIDESILIPDGRSLLDVLWATGKLELTLDEVTRPLDYESYHEARACGPNYKPRDQSQERAMEIFRRNVAERLRESVSSPADEPEEIEETPKPRITKSRNPRARRRATGTTRNGQKAVT